MPFNLKCRECGKVSVVINKQTYCNSKCRKLYKRKHQTSAVRKLKIRICLGVMCRGKTEFMSWGPENRQCARCTKITKDYSDVESTTTLLLTKQK